MGGAMKLSILWNGRTHALSVPLSATLARVLLDACTKLGLDYTTHGLLFQNKQLKDLSLTLRLSRIPNNASIQIVLLKESRTIETVTAVIQMPDGIRHQTTLSSENSIWEALVAVGADACADGLEPTVLLLNEKVQGRHCLQSTTFFSMGVLRGKALLKVQYEASAASSQSTPAVPIPSLIPSSTPAHLPVRVATPEISVSISTSSGPITAPSSVYNPSSDNNVLPTTNTHGTEDINTHSALAQKRNGTIQPNNGGHNRPGESRRNEGVGETRRTDSANVGFDWASDRERVQRNTQIHSEQPQTLAQMTGLSLEPSAPVSDAEAFPLRGFKFPDSSDTNILTSKPTSTPAPSSTSIIGTHTHATMAPEDRHIHIFPRKSESSREETDTPAGNDELPDAMFDVTVADLQILLRSTRSLTDPDRPLQLQKPDTAKDPRNMDKLITCVRLVLGDAIVQVEFHSTEELGRMYNVFRGLLAESCAKAAVLFTTPPMSVLPDTESETLLSRRLVGGVIIHARTSNQISLEINRRALQNHTSTNEEATERLHAVRVLNATSVVVEKGTTTTANQKTSRSAPNRGPGGPIPKWLKLSKK